MKTILLTLLLVVMTNTDGIAQSGNEWVDKVYDVKGDWSIEEDGDDKYFVLANNFYTLTGPDLKLYLSPLKMEEINNRDAVDQEGGVFVAELTSNKGAQKYKIPSGTNLSDFNSLVIHCRKFSVVWGGVNIKE